MREIKFRAWDKRNKKMVTHGLISMSNSFTGINTTSPILMQFTGLKDKNGKEIYEGDIIKGNDFMGVVKFQSYAWIVHRLDADGQVEEDFWIEQYEFEVVGNIYENPELLKNG